MSTYQKFVIKLRLARMRVWCIFTIFYIPTTPPRGGPSESCYGKKESVSVLGVLGVDEEDFRAALRDWTVEMALQSHDRSARGFPIGSGRCPHRRGRGEESCGTFTNTKKNKSAENAPPPPISSPVL